MAAIQRTTAALIMEAQGTGGFTSAEGERRLVREQTQMLGCQNSCQGKRKIEIEINCIDPGIVLVKHTTNPLSQCLSLLLFFAMSHSI